MNPIAFYAVAVCPCMTQYRTRDSYLEQSVGEEETACVPQGALVFL